MSKKISAKHPIWALLERYQQKMLAGVKLQSEKAATEEMAALGATRTEQVEAKKAEIAGKVAYLRNVQSVLGRPEAAMIESHYAKHTVDSAVEKIAKFQGLNPAVEVLTVEERSAIRDRHNTWAKAESERINNLFDAVQLKISLDDAVDEVLKVLADAGIKLPDITDVRALPLALDETIPVAGDTHVNVSAHADVYPD